MALRGGLGLRVVAHAIADVGKESSELWLYSLILTKEVEKILNEPQKKHQTR